jgi:hypothetical protein
MPKVSKMCPLSVCIKGKKGAPEMGSVPYEVKEKGSAFSLELAAGLRESLAAFISGNAGYLPTHEELKAVLNKNEAMTPKNHSWFVTRVIDAEEFCATMEDDTWARFDITMGESITTYLVDRRRRLF